VGLSILLKGESYMKKNKLSNLWEFGKVYRIFSPKKGEFFRREEREKRHKHLIKAKEVSNNRPLPPEKGK